MLVSKCYQPSQTSLGGRHCIHIGCCQPHGNTLIVKPDCPHCCFHTVIRYGYKCQKQGFFCKSCGKTFVLTTHTIMSNFLFWQKYGAKSSLTQYMAMQLTILQKRIGCFHQAIFDMRHKVLMALQQFPEISSVCLGEVSEFDETFVLDCGKGKEMDSSIPRGPCRHGAKDELIIIIAIGT